MDVIRNNNFTDDTYGTRVERLIAIEGNFASVQPFLQAPAHIADWAVDCQTVFSDVLATSGVEINFGESSTMTVVAKESILTEEYQKTRYLAYSIYKDLPDYFKDYGFDLAFPLRKVEKLNRVDNVLKTYARHSADGVTPLLPDLIISRLTDARNNYELAMNDQSEQKSIARHAVTLTSARFDSDTKMLIELKAWWYAMMGKSDPRITIIGMVNPKRNR
jgi:hypothetical protein